MKAKKLIFLGLAQFLSDDGGVFGLNQQHNFKLKPNERVLFQSDDYVEIEIMPTPEEEKNSNIGFDDLSSFIE